MATTMTFARVQDYLDAILEHATANDIDASPHKRFWRTMSYTEFTTGNVPHNLCHGQAIKIIDSATPRSSPFYLILQGGWCNKPQMPPDDDPRISDPNYTVTLPDHSIVTGQQMLNDIDEWLDNGFPE